MSVVHANTLNYRRTQRGYWHWLLIAIAAVMVGVSIRQPGDPVTQIALPSMSVLFLALSACFASLTVADDGDQLLIRFGPLPLLRKQIGYEAIQEVERDRTTFLDGWGIHLSLRGGWVWNIWGYDCVRIRYDGKTLRLGTDDPDGLIVFLNTRIRLDG
jgi:hypothetical protein